VSPGAQPQTRALPALSEAMFSAYSLCVEIPSASSAGGRPYGGECPAADLFQSHRDSWSVRGGCVVDAAADYGKCSQRARLLLQPTLHRFVCCAHVPCWTSAPLAARWICAARMMPYALSKVDKTIGCDLSEPQPESSQQAAAVRIINARVRTRVASRARPPGRASLARARAGRAREPIAEPTAPPRTTTKTCGAKAHHGAQMISLNGAVSRAAFSRGLLERPCRWATPRRGVRAAAACRSWWAPDSRQHPLVPVSQVGLTRTSDLAECIASCRREVAAIVAHHRVTGDRYVDCDFPVGDPEHGWRCIFEHPHELLHPADLLAPPEWKRLSDVYPPAELSLFRGEYADSGDIVQGNIGTCFFLGSLAAMAHGQKGWVRQLFVAHDAAAGVYGVRFFKRGRWECVLVDDLVGYPSPSGSRTSCLSTGHRDQFAVQRRPWFSHNSVEGTIWVAIIEKAYAKLHGSYEAINTGHTREAMVDLSGTRF
jgi:hypothetical protein